LLQFGHISAVILKVGHNLTRISVARVDWLIPDVVLRSRCQILLAIQKCTKIGRGV